MSRLLSHLAIFVTLLCSAWAQTAALGPQKTCADAQSMPNVNLTKFDGTWYEVARQPDNGWNCIEVDVSNSTVNNNPLLSINVTVATNPNMLNKNTTMRANVTLTAGSTAGFNVSYGDGAAMPNVTLKLLDTDYNNYAFVCGYTNASNTNSSFGVILTRQRVPDMSTLQGWQAQAAAEYTNFNKTMTMITQSAKCYTASSASSSVPALATIVTILFAILKYFN